MTLYKGQLADLNHNQIHPEKMNQT